VLIHYYYYYLFLSSLSSFISFRNNKGVGVQFYLSWRIFRNTYI